jgi:hypothetical protein
MSGGSTSGSSRSSSDAERALNDLLPLCAEFQAEFGKLIQNRDSGHLVLRVDFEKGRITSMEWYARRGRRVRPNAAAAPDALDDEDGNRIDS